MYRRIMLTAIMAAIMTSSIVAQTPQEHAVSTRRSTHHKVIPVIKPRHVKDSIVWDSQDNDQQPDRSRVQETLSDDFSELGDNNRLPTEQTLEPSVADIAEQRRQTLKDWPRIAMEDISIDPRDNASKVPPDRADPLIQRYSRDWTRFDVLPKDFCWVAPQLRHQPLYFEDAALERYRQRFINDYWQTAASGTHFFTSLILLPLHMRQDPIFSCDYPLGWCRPGTCPDRIYQRQFWGWCR